MAENFMREKIGLFIISWVSSVGDIEMPKEFNDFLIHNKDQNIDKFQLDLMSSFQVYTRENGVEEESIYRNLFSKKVYNRYVIILFNDLFSTVKEKSLIILKRRT